MALFIIASLLVIVGIAAIVWSGVNRVGDEPYCARCKFELTGIPGVNRCPECGCPLEHLTARIIGRRHPKAFRLGLILILISLPFFLFRYSQVSGASDQQKPLWWLRAEHAFVHQNDWRYFNELKRRLDSATQTSSRERRIAGVVLEQADALGGQPHVRDTVISAYRHALPADRSEHIGKLVQKWTDDGLNKQSLAFLYLHSYLDHSTNQNDIEPLVQYLENRRAALTEESTRFDIRQALDLELVGLVQRWWEGNGPGASAAFQERIRGKAIGIYVSSPTVMSKTENISFRIMPRFGGLVYDLPGWSHARITELRMNGEHVVMDYPIEFTNLLTNRAGARPVLLDLREFGTGTFEMEFDAQVFGSESAGTSELEWSNAYEATLRRTIRIEPSEDDVDAYWASEEIRQAAHDAIQVQRLAIVSVGLEDNAYDVWDLALTITDSPVNFKHDVYLEQGDQTWKLNLLFERVGGSNSIQTHMQFQATQARWASQAVPSEIKIPIQDEPVMIRLAPQPDSHDYLRDSAWPYEIVLGPFIPEK